MSPSENTSAAHKLLPAACLLILIVVCAVYAFGVSDTFILDDFHNLSPIAQNPGLPLVERFSDYVGGKIAGPTGRPVSALTFFANGTDWPTSATPYKLTNVFIHVLAGLLIGLLSNLLLKALGFADTGRRHIISVLIAAIWLLHPIHVSTTLYVVQRMTQLYTLFLLAAVTLYVHVRLDIHNANLAAPGLGVTAKQWTRLWAGCGLLCLLALGSKETAIVFPLLILALDATVLSELSWPARRGKLLWRSCAVVLPLILFISYTAWTWPKLVSRFAIHNFDLGERLLTQPRVLLDYAGTLVAPRVRGLGLFHDDFVVSHGLFDPLSTFVALAILIGAVTFSLVFRKKFKTLAFAVLWFVGAHALEAGPFPVELYFEHRNYLPSVGFAFGAGVAIATLMQKSPALVKVLTPVALMLLAGISVQNSLAWKTPVAQAAIWANEHPESVRARVRLSHSLRIRGAADKAIDAVEPSSFKNPQSIHYLIHAATSCMARREPAPTWKDSALATINPKRAWMWLPTELEKILRSTRDDRCNVSLEDMVEIIDAHLVLPVYALDERTHYNLMHLKATLLGDLQKFDDLEESIELAIKLHDKPQSYLTKAQLSLRVNDVDRAEEAMVQGLVSFKKSNTSIQRLLKPQFDSILAEISARRASTPQASTAQPTGPE